MALTRVIIKCEMLRSCTLFLINRLSAPQKEADVRLAAKKMGSLSLQAKNFWGGVL